MEACKLAHKSNFIFLQVLLDIIWDDFFQ